MNYSWNNTFILIFDTSFNMRGQAMCLNKYWGSYGVFCVEIDDFRAFCCVFLWIINEITKWACSSASPTQRHCAVVFFSFVNYMRIGAH